MKRLASTVDCHINTF